MANFKQTKKVKDSELFSELDGKSSREVAEIVKGHVANKEYTAEQLERIGNRYKDDPNVIKAIMEGLRCVVETGDKITDRQLRAYQETVRTVNMVLADPNASNELKLKALDLMKKCYRGLVATNIVVIGVICATVIALCYLIIKIIMKGKDKE